MSTFYKKILVPLDGSEIAAQALPHAQELAAVSGAELVLLEVVPDLKEEIQLNPRLGLVRPAEEHQAYLVDHAARWLQGVAGDIKLHKISAKAVVDVGEAADKILDYATKYEIDLIVMSTHGRSGLARWAYGSVANKVLNGARCPVLLVRSQL